MSIKKYLLSFVSVCAVLSASAQDPFKSGLFCPIDTNFHANTLVFPPSPIQSVVVLSQDDNIYNIEKNQSSTAKKGFGALYQGVVTTNKVTTSLINRVNTANLFMTFTSDNNWNSFSGGGLLMAKVVNDTLNGSYTEKYDPANPNNSTFKLRNVDVTPTSGLFGLEALDLGYTNFSQSIKRGQMFAAEHMIASNALAFTLSGDSANFTVPNSALALANKSLKKYENSGWIVEIDRLTGNFVSKHYELGRMHRSGLAVISSRIAENSSAIAETYFITNTLPSVIIKTETISGQVRFYAFQESSADFILLNSIGTGSEILSLTDEELMDIHKLALSKGATMYNKLSSLTKNHTNGVMYIAETGGNITDGSFSDANIIYSGELASHLVALDELNGADGKFEDPYGRILVLDPDNKTVRVLVNGGKIPSNNRYVFSNPDNLCFQYFQYDDGSGSGYQNYEFLAVSEAVSGTSNDRQPAHITQAADYRNEIYFLEFNDTGGSDLNHIKAFAVLPPGARAQMTMNPQYSSPLYVSISNPNPANAAPYNKDVVVSFLGFENYFVSPDTGCKAHTGGGGGNVGIDPVFGHKNHNFVAYPNPTDRVLSFNKVCDVVMYDQLGRIVKSYRRVNEMDVSDLTPGVYFLNNELGESLKIVIQR